MMNCAMSLGLLCRGEEGLYLENGIELYLSASMRSGAKKLEVNSFFWNRQRFHSFIDPIRFSSPRLWSVIEKRLNLNARVTRITGEIDR